MSNQDGGFGQQSHHGSPAPKADTFDLKPLTLADMLDYTVRLFRKEWKPILVLVTLLSIPNVAIAMFSGIITGPSFGSTPFSTPEETAVSDEFLIGTGLLILGTFAISTLVALIFGPLVVAGITRLTAARYLGRPVTAKVAVRSMLALWLTLIGASILTSLILGAGLILCVIPGIVMGAFLFLVLPVVVVEETSASEALSRSFSLVKHDFWRYLGTTVLGVVVASMFYLVITVALFTAQWLLLLAGGAVGVWWPFGVVFGVLSGFAEIITRVTFIAVYAILATLIYFDARVRYEGFDLQMMASRFDDDRRVPGADNGGSAGQPGPDGPLG